MPKNTAPGLGARNTASTFDAIQNALNLYLKLKDKESDDKHWEQEQALKQSGLERQNRSTDAQTKYYDALAAGAGRDDVRQQELQDINTTKALFDSYGGQPIEESNPAVTRARRIGMDVGLEPATGTPRVKENIPETSPTPTTFGPMPGQNEKPQYFSPTAMTIRETNPAKLRGQQDAIRSREGIAAVAEEGRNNRAAITHADKAAALSQSAWFKTATQNLQRAGLGNQTEMLKLAIINSSRASTIADFNMEDKAYDNATKGGSDINSLMRMMTVAGQAAPPPNPTPRVTPRPGMPNPPPRGTTSGVGTDPSQYELVGVK